MSTVEYAFDPGQTVWILNIQTIAKGVILEASISIRGLVPVHPVVAISPSPFATTTSTPTTTALPLEPTTTTTLVGTPIVTTTSVPTSTPETSTPETSDYPTSDGPTTTLAPTTTQSPQQDVISEWDYVITRTYLVRYTDPFTDKVVTRELDETKLFGSLLEATLQLAQI